MHIGSLQPVAALELKTDCLAHRQEGEVVLPNRGACEINSLPVVRLNETRAARSAHVLDSSNHPVVGALSGPRCEKRCGGDGASDRRLAKVRRLNESDLVQTGR